MKRVDLESIVTDIDYGITESATDENTGCKFLRITDIREGRINWKNVPFCKCAEKDEQKYTLQESDIVFARTGSVGNTCLLSNLPKKVVFASYLIRIRPIQKLIYPQFLSFYFQTTAYWKQIEMESVGAIQGGINASKLKKLQIPLPPLPEQQRIAAILQKADRLRRLRRYARQLSDGYLQSVFLEMFGDPVKNTKKWPLSQFNMVCDSRLGKMLDDKKQTGKYKRRYLRNFNVQWFNFDLSNIAEMDFDEKDQLEFRLKYGDILICEGGEVGRTAIWRDEIKDCYFQKALHRVRPNLKLVNSEYIMYLMWWMAKNGGLGDFTSQVTIAHLTGEKLKELIIPLPPISKQNEFFDIVMKYNLLSQKQTESERQTDHLFQSLLQLAFQGEL